MADKMSDAEIRKELIALGEKSIGPITDTTRPLYLKKLARLKSENKSKSFKGRGRNKQLVALSSDESDQEDDTQDTSTSYNRKSSNRSRSLRSNTSLNISNAARKTLNVSRPVDTGKETVVTRRHVVKTSTVPRHVDRDETGNGDTFNSTLWDDEPHTRSAMLQTSFDSTLNRTRGYDDTSRLNDKDFGNEFSDSDREDIKPSVVSQAVNTSPRLNDSSRWTPRFGNWKTKPYVYKSLLQSTSRTGTYSPRMHSSFADQTGIMGTDGFKAKESSSSFTFSQFISAFIVVLAILFFGFLTFMYLSMQRAEDAREQDSNLLICEGIDGEGFDGCFKKERVHMALNVVKEISSKLMEQAGRYECGYDENRSLPVRNLEDHLKRKFGSNFGRGSNFEYDFLIALELFVNNPSWKIKLYDGTGAETSRSAAIISMEAQEANMGLFCRIRRSIDKMFRSLILFTLVVLAFLALVWYMRYRWKKEKEEQKQVFNLVEKIINILKDHHEACLTDKSIEPYVAIPHIRDQLIPMRERKKKQHLWEKAVKFLSENESRVREETRTIHGEDFHAWRWIHISPNGGKVWQGQAFGETNEATSNIPSFMPLPCLKIRNMFDLEAEYERDWHVKIQDAILEKCGPAHGVVHIAVDKKSSEGCVYVKCNAKEAAGRAFYALHGSWFDSRLVTVKFLRLERYHERFPEAARCTKPLRPSDDSKSSLAQPFHKSFLEQY